MLLCKNNHIRVSECIWICYRNKVFLFFARIPADNRYLWYSSFLGLVLIMEILNESPKLNLQNSSTCNASVIRENLDLIIIGRKRAWGLFRYPLCVMVPLALEWWRENGWDTLCCLKPQIIYLRGKSILSYYIVF